MYVCVRAIIVPNKNKHLYRYAVLQKRHVGGGGTLAQLNEAQECEHADCAPGNGLRVWRMHVARGRNIFAASSPKRVEHTSLCVQLLPNSCSAVCNLYKTQASLFARLLGFWGWVGRRARHFAEKHRLVEVTMLFKRAAEANPLDSQVFVALGVMENINRHYEVAGCALWCDTCIQSIGSSENGESNSVADLQA